MLLRIGELHRLRLLGDEADKTLAAAKMGVVHRGGVQALGGKQLERSIAAAEVNRTHLGDHVGGDQHRHLIEACFSALALGHDLAQAPQQQSRGAHRARSWHHPLLVGGLAANPYLRKAELKEVVSFCPARRGNAGSAPPALHRPRQSRR